MVGGTNAPSQNVLSGTGFITGVGFIVTVNVIGALVHVTPPLVTEAVAVKVDTSGVLPAFVAVYDGTLPVPAVGTSPIAAGVLVQLKVTPGTLLVKTTDGTVDPAQ